MVLGGRGYGLILPHQRLIAKYLDIPKQTNEPSSKRND